MSAFLWTVQAWFAVHIVLSISALAGAKNDDRIDRAIRGVFLAIQVAFVCWSIALLDRMP